MDINKIKSLAIIKTIKPDFIISSQDLDNGYKFEEWATTDTAVPEWWNQDFHILKEMNDGQKDFHKWCIDCGMIPDHGCKHNLVIEKCQR